MHSPSHSPLALNRREVLAGSATVAAGLVAGVASAQTKPITPTVPVSRSNSRFQLHYGPHPGMFQNSAGRNV
ncbi:MAG: twin-arginine translocation signal domain-containing protein, partial [Planctomycetes bacterium]|nr:twin-arginine translocation signal domain-containing protein [Planctomycetota bacterium]